MTIVEGVYRFVAVRPIMSKGNAVPDVLSFIKYVGKQCGHTASKAHADEEQTFVVHFMK